MAKPSTLYIPRSSNYPRLKRLFGLARKSLGIRKLRIHVLRDAHDPTGDLEGLYWRTKNTIFIRTRTSYRWKKKIYYSWRYLRGILTHELAHVLGGMYHRAPFKRAMRRVDRLLRKLENAKM